MGFRAAPEEIRVGGKSFRVGEKLFRVGEKGFRVGRKWFRVGEESFRVGKKLLRVGEKPFRVGKKSFPPAVLRWIVVPLRGYRGLLAPPQRTLPLSPPSLQPPQRRELYLRRDE